MNFSYHPKYEEIALKVKDFLVNESIDIDANFIVGGDGSLFVYADFNKPNFLISSHRLSKGYYSACFYEENYKEKILKYASNQSIFERNFDTIEAIVNGNPLPERAINDIMIGKDYFLKANIDSKKVYDTGLLIYTKNGCNAWASKFGGVVYENNLGWVLLDERIPHKIEDSLNIEILKHHDTFLMIDGKGINLKRKYVHKSDRENVYIAPWELKKKDNIIIKKGNPIIIVK